MFYDCKSTDIFTKTASCQHVSTNMIGWKANFHWHHHSYLHRNFGTILFHNERVPRLTHFPLSFGKKCLVSNSKISMSFSVQLVKHHPSRKGTRLSWNSSNTYDNKSLLNCQNKTWRYVDLLTCENRFCVRFGRRFQVYRSVGASCANVISDEAFQEISYNFPLFATGMTKFVVMH